MRGLVIVEKIFVDGKKKIDYVVGFFLLPYLALTLVRR